MEKVKILVIRTIDKIRAISPIPAMKRATKDTFAPVPSQAKCFEKNLSVEGIAASRRSRNLNNHTKKPKRPSH